MQLDVKLVTATNVILAFWGYKEEESFDAASHGLNTSTFKTIQFSWKNTGANAITFIEWSIGQVYGYFNSFAWPASNVQSTGTAIVKNFTVFTPAASALNHSGTLNMTGNMTAQAYVTASDESIKEGVQAVDAEACMTMLKNIEAKTYTRNDLETTDKRVGYIAQDVQQWIPEEFANVLGVVYGNVNGPLVGLDYSRLGSPILWTICKKQQEQIEQLTARVEALEQTSA